MMNAKLRERVLFVLASIPLGFVLSLMMRAVVGLCTPGWWFVKWFVPRSHGGGWLGPEAYYIILVDFVFCWAIVLLVYWLFQSSISKSNDGV